MVGKIKDFANKHFGGPDLTHPGKGGAQQGKAFKSTLIYAASAIDSAAKRQAAAVRKLTEDPNDDVRITYSTLRFFLKLRNFRML